VHSALKDKKIVVTRAQSQAAALCEALKMRGALPLEYPCIQIVPPANAAPLDEALLEIARGAYDGLVLTSVNTPRILAQRLSYLGLEQAVFQNVWIAAIGPATAQAAQETLGRAVNLIPSEYVAESLANSIRPRRGERILLPRAEAARAVLVEILEKAGASVKVVTAYRALPASGGVDLPALVENRQVDAVALTSSSIARSFVERFASEGGQIKDLRHVCVACIGPITADAAVRAGLTVRVVAQSYTTLGLLAALETYFMNDKEQPCN